MAKETEVANAPTMQDIMAMIAAMNEANQKQMMEFAAELRKPTAEQEEKTRLEAEKREKLHKMRVAEAKSAEEARKGAQNRCAHKKKDGFPAWGGQVNSDGYVRPICCICLKIMPEIKAPQEWIENGVNFQDKQVFPVLPENVLLKWHEMYGPKPKHVPVGQTA